MSNFDETLMKRLTKLEREVERLRVKESPIIAPVMLSIYPIGAIYMSVSSTNPGTLFGGTWVAWGTGKVPVGIDTGDTDFDTVEETGGAKTHTNPLSDNGAAKIGTVGGVAAHIHRSTLTKTWNSSHAVVGTAGSTTPLTYGAGLMGDTDSGSSLQPYIVCYMWKRTA